MLLAGGCDYWTNLVDGKKITQVALTIRVKDALTGEPLPYSVCEDASRGLAFPLDDMGSFKDPSASTGSYSMVCRMSGYYDAKVDFNVDKNGAPITASLARLGGQDWYPEELFPQMDSLRVHISLIGNLRVPGKMIFRASPFLASGEIRYRWKSSLYPQLNRDWSNAASGNPDFTVALKSLPSDENLDTIYLYVRSRLGGHPEYDVDSFSITVNWVRNRLPVWTPLIPPITITRVGCTVVDTTKRFSVFYNVSDPDGDRPCTVYFSSIDASSALGLVNSNQPCGLVSVNFPILDPFFTLPQDSKASLQDTSLLYMKVVDANGQSRDTTFRLITYPNVQPTSKIVKLDTLPIHYSGKEMKFQFLGSVPEGGLNRLIINWGDNSLGLDLDLDRNYPLYNSFDNTFGHRYLDSGSYQVSSRIYDACGFYASYALPLIHVQANHLPELRSMDTLGYHLQGITPVYRIQLAVFDADLESRQDSVRVVVIWGEGLADTLKVTASTVNQKQILDHYYAKPPPDTYVDLYHLSVTVTDANDGIAISKFDIRPY